MGIFFTKQVHQRKNTLGNLLKNTRLKYKLKMHHIEKYTNIRRSYLIAIENNQWEQLPNLTYAKNYVLTYAKFLELDIHKITNRFDIESQFVQNHNKTITNLANNTPSKFILTPKTTTISLVLLIFFIIGLYTYFQINAFVQTPKLDISKPSDYTQVTVNKVDISGNTDPDNIIYINNQLLTTDKNGNFSTPVQLKNGYNIIKVTAENKIGRTTTATKIIYANLFNQNNFRDQLNLTITATNKDIWVKIKNDNITLYEGLIKANDTKNFTSDSSIFLTSTNAGATQISINDQPLGSLGEPDEIIENIQISNQPLANSI